MTSIVLTMVNAGVVRGWLEQHGVPATMRGGPGGGSIGGTVIVNHDGTRLVIEPGDTVRVVAGRVMIS